MGLVQLQNCKVEEQVYMYGVILALKMWRFILIELIIASRLWVISTHQPGRFDFLPVGIHRFLAKISFAEGKGCEVEFHYILAKGVSVALALALPEEQGGKGRYSQIHLVTSRF